MELQNRGTLSSFSLKVIMAVLMVMDHLYYYFPETIPLWFTILGRLVAPVFTFIMTEGLLHTRDRRRYVLRLLYWGLGMMGVNIVLLALTSQFVPMDIFLSLAVSAGMISVIDKLREEGASVGRVLGLIGLIAATVFVEGMIICPIMALAFYYLRYNKLLMCIAYIVSSAAVCILLMGFPNIQLWMLAAIVPILLYNGKRGPNNAFSKYFFYLFYPVHIWILFFINLYVHG